MDGTGFHGLAVHTAPLVAPISGLFGITFQVSTNFSLHIHTDDGNTIPSGFVTFTFSNGGSMTNEVIEFQPGVLYQRTFPNNTDITITVVGKGFEPFTTTFNIGIGQYALIHAHLKPQYINVRRYYR